MIGHGSFDIKVDNQVCLSRINGAWNKEEARLYCTKLKDSLKELIKQPWAMIVYLNDWELGTPETEQISNELVQWCMEHDLRKIVTVYSPNLIKNLQIERLTIKSIGAVDFRCFAQEKEAFAWLKSEGYVVNHSHFTPPET